MTAQTITVKMSRGDNTSWGFRLQGGKDFSTPLSVQRVNPGSLADSAGLISGDAILKILGRSTETMKHKEAQDTILKSGNNLELLVQRGGVRVWKPTVTPVGDMPAPTTPNSAGVFTQTSLAAKKQEFTPIGSKHNVAPRPFANIGGGKLLVNTQYNTPAPLYSMNNIADTLSAHTEVLSSGAKGINFMKEAQPVNKDSAVYRMIMEEKSGPEDHNHVGPQVDVLRKDSPMKQPMMTQHVAAPVTKPASQLSQKPVDPNACGECGKSIIGVFVRIKDKSLHPECFRCSTCGTSLKNVGYFNVKDKLYCDIHAQQAARVASSTPTYEPVVIGQLQDKPAVAPPTNSPTPQTPIPAPMSPSTYRSISPVPFHRTGEVHHVEAPTSPQTMLSPPIFKSSAVAPSFNTPASSVTFKPSAPASQIAAAPVLPPSALVNVNTGSAAGSKFVWPPPKNQPSDPVLVSNTTPSQPTYRPPPGTQHVIGTPGTPKFSSPISPLSQVPPASNFLAQKTPPTTCPKPHTPVQSIMAAGTGHPWSSTSTSSLAPSGVPMSAGTGSRPAPRRGRGQLKQQAGTGVRIPICSICGTPIRGPFVTALGKTWCPEHFLCANNRCHRNLADIGFVENQGQLYCENCYEVHLAPLCSKCSCRIKGDCLNALDKQWHPDCFLCAYCHKPFGNSSFYMEDGLPYCEKDWNELFTTKCVGCGFPIEAGDRWVEALNNNYHSLCFKCTICHKNLEGQSFYAKGGRPFCKTHAR